MNADLRECIEKLDATDGSETIRALALLDSAGMLICPGEALDAYIRRISGILDELDSISSGDSQFKSIYSGASRVPGAMADAASDITWGLYSFRAKWIPAWESKKHVGLLSEGIQYEVDGFFPMIFLRNALSAKSAQILAHEMCHAARTGFPSSSFDEWFARKTEPSAFRNALGNFFRDWRIPAVASASVIAGTTLSALGQMAPWGICSLAPAAAIIAREAYLRRTIAAAKIKLNEAGFDALPLLFRMDDAEMRSIAKSENPAVRIRDAAKASLRWSMYAAKFGPNKAPFA